jgi:ion channel
MIGRKAKLQMQEKAQSRWDLFLLLSLLLVMVSYPVLDHGDLRKLILRLLFFVPVVVATVRMSQLKAWLWPSVLSMSGSFILAVITPFFPNRTLIGMKWGMLTVFFALCVVNLFSYLKNARSILNAHLYTAVSIYLLLGMQWFALYSAIDAFYPGSFLFNGSVGSDPRSELLYFSLVTLSTIGYGDIVPLHGEVRILAALEGVTGVIYIAIMVAIIVSLYKRPGDSQ